jgi:hypothetical protein
MLEDEFLLGNATPEEVALKETEFYGVPFSPERHRGAIGATCGDLWYVRFQEVLRDAIKRYIHLEHYPRVFEEFFRKNKNLPMKAKTLKEAADELSERFSDSYIKPEITDDLAMELVIFYTNKAVAEEASHASFDHEKRYVEGKELERYCRRLVLTKPEIYGKYREDPQQFVNELSGKIFSIPAIGPSDPKSDIFFSRFVDV